MKLMKKWIPVLTVLVLILAACSGGGGQATPTASSIFGTSTPSTGGTSSVPNTGATQAFPTMEATSGTSAAVPTTAGTSGVSATSVGTLAATTAATAVMTQAPATAAATSPAAMNTQTSLSTLVATSGATPVTSTMIPVIPSTGTGTGQIVSLASMMKYRVMDNTGAAIGAVSDYVVNVCEAHILYVVVTPDASLNLQGGKQLLIPYEAFFATPNSGKIDPASGVLTLNVAVSSLSNAPTVDVTSLDMQNPTWDSSIMAYWRQNFRLGLTTGCNIPAPGPAVTASEMGTAVPSGTTVPLGTVSPTGQASTAQPNASGTPAAGAAPTYSVTKTANRQTVYRVGLASKILGAPLQEGNGTTIGQDVDVAVIIQTGGIIYYVVQATAGVQGSSGALGTASPGVGTAMPQGTSVPNTGSGTTSPNTGTATSGISNAGGGRLIALPPAAVNIRYANNANGQLSPALVLLAQTNVFLQSPAYDAQTGTNESAWFSYWQKFVPMTQSEVP